MEQRARGLGAPLQLCVDNHGRYGKEAAKRTGRDACINQCTETWAKRKSASHKNPTNSQNAVKRDPSETKPGEAIRVMFRTIR